MELPDFMFSPLTFAWVVTLLVTTLWRRIPRWCRWTGVALVVLAWLAMAPVGANLLVLGIESRVPSITACEKPLPATIVVLSGGTDRRPRSADDFSALSASSLHRLFAGIKLWQRTPGARLVIAGGSWGVPESVLLANLAERMGVPRGAIETEQRSHTTWENALNVATLSPAVPRRIWLVSSALHLPRAVGAFRAWGFEPCAWPSESLYVPFSVSVGYFMPQRSSLAKVDLAIHELLGGLAYRVLEWKKEARHTGEHAGSG